MKRSRLHKGSGSVKKERLSRVGTGETYADRLEKIAKSNTSTEEDEKVILYLLRTSGLPNAVVAYGIVYPTGYGHPMSIQSVAKSILESARKGKKVD